MVFFNEIPVIFECTLESASLNCKIKLIFIRVVPHCLFQPMFQYLPEGFNLFSSLDECKQQVNQRMHKEVQDKKQELESCEFVMENCLYLVWAHLDYFMLQAIPSKTLGVAKPLGQSKSFENGVFTKNCLILIVMGGFLISLSCGVLVIPMIPHAEGV